MDHEALRVRGLDDPRSTEVAIAGAKGAGLARALAAGFPVLDGFVIPAACSEPALQAAVEVLDARGTGGSRMTIIGYDVPGELAAQIDEFAGALPAPLIVRSSSVLEGSGEWSGAFTSVPEIECDEVVKAMKSVWATTFSIEVLERFEEADIEPGSAPMGVLVQPEVRPDFGGAAIVGAGGAITINAVKGSPRDLMAGWVAGSRAVLEDGVLSGAEAIELMGEATVRDVADLAQRVQTDLGHNLIEWAVVDDKLLLLQVQDSAVHEADEPMVVPAALAHPFALHFVKLAHAHPGALADELVLGWRSGASVDLRARPYEGTDRDAAYAEAQRIAAELTSAAWGEPAETAMAHAALVLRRMRSDRPNESIDALRELNPVDEDQAAVLLGIVDYLERTDATPDRRGRGRWEPVLAGVLALQGEVHDGEPSVGGVGAGRLVWVDSSKRTDDVRPRDIIVTQYPLQNFSPLLWDAAGLITVGGAPTAHLFEVARSLTVPAVINCPIADIVRDGPCLGMLDGDAGRVSILRA